MSIFNFEAIQFLVLFLIVYGRKMVRKKIFNILQFSFEKLIVWTLEISKIYLNSWMGWDFFFQVIFMKDKHWKGVSAFMFSRQNMKNRLSFSIDLSTDFFPFFTFIPRILRLVLTVFILNLHLYWQPFSLPSEKLLS